jgi:hypothetical protein
VAGCDFLAYSCAAARDSHPLPNSRHGDEDARTKIVKEQDLGRGWNLRERGGGSQTVGGFEVKVFSPQRHRENLNQL